jgi:anti-sigma regulatory factor (Ser/Thr protein kinase)
MTKQGATPAPRDSPAPAAPPGVPRPGSRYASAELAPEPASASRARRLVRDTLATWGLAAVTDAAEAVASELAANAATAALPPAAGRPAIILAVYDRPPGVTIFVWDNGPGKPEPANAGRDAESGRGLAIIDALTESDWDWWATPDSGGKVVRATIPATQTRNPDQVPEAKGA